MGETLGVAELLNRLDEAVVSTFPGPVWVRGEVSGYRRTNRGAVFFRLVDVANADRSVEVGIRGRVMSDIDRALDAAKVGSLREGIEVRLMGTVRMRLERGSIQLSVVEIDPEFIAGKLALDREEILRRLAADGTLKRNGELPVPIVPLRIGLITSRGSAAHADFLNQLSRPGYRFRVKTVEAMMQGGGSPEFVERALARLRKEDLDLVAIVRGGGSKLDLAAFDDERVGRAIGGMPFPVITGIGHEIDTSVADEAASIAMKTPTAAAEWIVARVTEYANRLEIARQAIRDQAKITLERVSSTLESSAASLAGSRSILERQRDLLGHLGADVADRSRTALTRHGRILESLTELVTTVGLEPTLKRGFAVVTDTDERPIRSVAALEEGSRVHVMMADGTASMTVEEVLE